MVREPQVELESRRVLEGWGWVDQRWSREERGGMAMPFCIVGSPIRNQGRENRKEIAKLHLPPNKEALWCRRIENRGAAVCNRCLQPLSALAAMQSHKSRSDHRPQRGEMQMQFSMVAATTIYPIIPFCSASSYLTPVQRPRYFALVLHYTPSGAAER